MGWWKKGEDVFGDGPVDLFEEALTEFVRQEPKPTWDEFVSATAAVLSADAASILDHPASWRDQRVHARFESGIPDVVSGQPTHRGEFHEALSGALKNISEEYQDYKGRKPRLTEILGTMAFTLRFRPERFLSVPADGASLSEIVVEPQ